MKVHDENRARKSMQPNAVISITHTDTQSVQAKKAILRSSVSLQFVSLIVSFTAIWMSTRAHALEKHADVRMLSHNIDWTYLCVPLEAGSRNIAALRGNRNHRRVVGGMRWLADRPWRSARCRVDEETEEEEERGMARVWAIMISRICHARVQRITHADSVACERVQEVTRSRPID